VTGHVCGRTPRSLGPPFELCMHGQSPRDPFLAWARPFAAPLFLSLTRSIAFHGTRNAFSTQRCFAYRTPAPPQGSHAPLIAFAVRATTYGALWKHGARLHGDVRFAVPRLVARAFCSALRLPSLGPPAFRTITHCSPEPMGPTHALDCEDRSPGAGPAYWNFVSHHPSQKGRFEVPSDAGQLL
jgi:hypothetical protein